MSIVCKRLFTMIILSLLGTFELIWLFYSINMYSEIIFLFIICSLITLFSSLASIDEPNSITFNNRSRISVVLLLLAFILLI
ncbi:MULTISPECIES: hypothetical protein [Bacillus]|uniref:hypothetical protein n=1 Tax=Bacillus TaxID=1386 RepID=UPI0011DD5E19|nr:MULTISPECIES: hypothetical protein [Bacillus]